VWLPDSKKTLMIHLAISIEKRHVMDGQTDGSIVRTMHIFVQ